MGLPGRSSGCPPLPPQTRTCPIKASGSSVAMGRGPRRTKQVTPRLAHNFCCPMARSDAVDDPGHRQREDLPIEGIELLDVHVAFAVALSQPVPPGTFGMLENDFEHFVIASYAVILVIAAQLGTKRSAHL